MLILSRKYWRFSLSLLAGFLLCSCSLPELKPSSLPQSAMLPQTVVTPEQQAYGHFSRSRLLVNEGRQVEALAELDAALALDPESLYLQLEQIQVAFANAEQDLARQRLQVLLEKRPDVSAVQQLAAEISLVEHDYAAASRYFQRAAELDPQQDNLVLQQALALAQSERSHEAIALLQQLTSKTASFAEAWLLLARLYQDAEQRELAVAAYRQVLRLEPGQAQAVLGYGALLEAQDKSAVIDFYRQNLQDNPAAVQVRQRLAELLLRQSLTDEALREFEIVARQWPGNPQLLVRIGLLQLQLQQWQAAEQSWRQLLQETGQADSARYYLALALTGQQRLTEALPLLEEIPPATTVYPDAVLKRAWLYSQGGDDDSAIAALRQALAAGVSGEEHYYFLASLLMAQERTGEALTLLREAVDLYPQSAPLFFQLGLLYERSGERQQAVAAMEQVVLSDPENVDALNFLAWHQAEYAINLPLALKRARTAIALKESAYIVDTLGWVLYKLGRYHESRDVLEKAVRLAPEDDEIVTHLAELYRQLGLYGLAEESYRKALELNPQAGSVKERLQKMLEGKNR